MAVLVNKENPNKGLFEGNTTDYLPEEYYLLSDLPHAATKWANYDIITTVPDVDQRYWKNDGTAIVEMTQVEKDVIDSEKSTTENIERKTNIPSNRIEFKKDFLNDISGYMADLGYSMIDIISVFRVIGDAMIQMDRIDIEAAKTTINNIAAIDKFTKIIKDEMILIIDNYLTTEL